MTSISRTRKRKLACSPNALNASLTEAPPRARRNRLSLSGAACAAALAFAACAAPSSAGQEAFPRLHEVFRDDFLIGVSLEHSELPDGDGPAAHGKLLTHFNALTPENDMKWQRLQPTEGEFRFDASDALLAYADKHGMRFTAHTLVWHRQTPDWIFSDSEGEPASRELALSRLRHHIHVVMQRYRGRVAGWDVVNEALSDSPGEYLRDSPWLRAIGEDYVVLAFQFAREADPAATLYYNDYALEYPHKRKNMVRLMQELEAAGVSPHAVNLQGHYSLVTPTLNQIEDTLEAIARLGLRANISELDVSLFHYGRKDNPYPESPPAEVLEKQAQRYGALFTLFRRHAAKIDRVTFWNLHDGVSWLNNEPVPGRPDYPLLFDREGQPKAAFFAVIGAARH